MTGIARTRYTPTIAHCPQLSAQNILAARYTKRLVHSRHKFNQSPAQNTVAPRCGPVINSLSQSRTVLVIQLSLCAKLFAGNQTIRAFSVETFYPITQNLARHRRQIRHLTPRTTFINRCQRQQPARLIRVPTPLRQPSKRHSVVIHTQNQFLTYSCLHHEALSNHDPDF
jgi:hypothetical protein